MSWVFFERVSIEYGIEHVPFGISCQLELTSQRWGTDSQQGKKTGWSPCAPIVKTKHREIPDMAYYHSPEANSHIETIKCA